MFSATVASTLMSFVFWVSRSPEIGSVPAALEMFSLWSELAFTSSLPTV